MAMQAKLLRTLEDREITPVGSNKARPIDIRLICATNLPLHEMVSRREFRQDLLYRINTIEIVLPPLRERREDIPLLIDYFSALYFRKYKRQPKKIDRETIACLQSYDWPGNVRELRHAVERAVIVSESNELRPEDFSLAGAGAPRAVDLAEGGTLESIEKSAIQRCLERTEGNISRSADELGLTRASLYRRILKYGLQKLSR
jgi:transcriptional regulator with PAS, ATPase and Fis domain